MKNRTVYSFILCFLILSMCACTGPRQPDYTMDSTPVTTDSQVTVQPPEPLIQEISLDQTVVYDEDGIRITATGMRDGFMGKEISFLVENNTNKNIAFSGDLFIINGITVSGYVYIDVAAGKKSNDTLSVFSSDLQAAGIDRIGTVECKDASIVDTDSYETLDDVSFALKTSAAGTFDQLVTDDGNLIYEDKGITVISQLLSNEFYGNSVRLLVRNQTDDDITVQAENISVNGFTVDAWMYDKVYGNTVRYCELDLFSSGLDENGIESIETVTFRLKIIDPDSFDTIAASDEIVIELK